MIIKFEYFQVDQEERQQHREHTGRGWAGPTIQKCNTPGRVSYYQSKLVLYYQQNKDFLAQFKEFSASFIKPDLFPSNLMVDIKKMFKFSSKSKLQLNYFSPAGVRMLLGSGNMWPRQSMIETPQSDNLQLVSYSSNQYVHKSTNLKSLAQNTK